MKKIFVVLVLAAALVFAFGSVASAKYAGFDAGKAYLPWADANTIYNQLNGTTGGQASPHGGYTQTSVKCVVCHSTHRAASNRTSAGVGTDWSLLNGMAGSCVACHAAWGSSPSSALIEVGQVQAGPHIGPRGNTCGVIGVCHGSVHGGGTPSKYAIAVKYNLTNASEESMFFPPEANLFEQNLDAQMDAAIAAGNVNAEINTTNTGRAMKAFATGYVCFPCHTNSSFSVATRAFANEIRLAGENPFRTGHPSAGPSTTPWVPTCESCHDVVGVATNSTAFPHSNRGIDVYTGRYDANTDAPVVGAVIPTTNGDATRYVLWMTSGTYGNNASAKPIPAATNLLRPAYTLQDGVCIKCHNPAGLK